MSLLGWLLVIVILIGAGMIFFKKLPKSVVVWLVFLCIMAGLYAGLRVLVAKLKGGDGWNGR